MKNLFTVIITLILMCSFLMYGCGKSSTTIRIGNYRYALDGDIVEQSIDAVDAANGVQYFYKDKDEICNIMVIKYENHENYDAETYAELIGEKYHGCVEHKVLPSIGNATLVTYLDDVDGTKYFVKDYFINDGNDLYSLTYSFYTKEVRLGTSELYTYVPLMYAEGITSNYEGVEDITLYEIEDSTYFPVMYVCEWNDGAWSYDYIATNGLTEEKFDELDTDGWTLEDIHSLYKVIYPDTDESFIKDINGLKVAAYVHYYDQSNGLNITQVNITVKVDDRFTEIILSGPTETWGGAGKAFAYGVHTK